VPLALEGSSLNHAELLLPPQLTEPLHLTPADLGGTAIIGDASTPGISTYLLTLDETSLNHLLHRLFFPDGGDDDRYRDLQVDLQPGGLILYADVKLGLRWQRIGLLLREEANEVSLTPAGVVVEQELYAMPEDGSLPQLLSPAHAYAERTLKMLVITGPLPGKAHVAQVRFQADRLQILAQATYDAPPPPDTGWQSLASGVELREIDVAAGDLTERLRIVRLDPAQVRFRVRYDPAHTRKVSAWAVESPALLTVNAGYFTAEGQATALIISGGQRAGTRLGDFAGMFAITAEGGVSVRWLRERPYDPAEPLTEAVQSFPVLVKPGGVMGFPADADEGASSRRTVVAQDHGGNILFIVAPRGILSLHELAAFLAASDLGVDIALNLDGGGSTGLWLEVGGVSVTIDSLTPVPSVIVVEPQ